MAGLMINDDFMRFVASKYHDGYEFGEVTEKDVREFIQKLAGSTITDFVFNVNAQLSYTYSDVWETAEDKYNKTEENSHLVNYKNSYYKVWYDLFILQKLDMYKVWIEELNKININPWMSFRLNDTHDNGKRYGGERRSDFCDKARERGLVRINHREKDGYFDDCLDFKHEEVRNYHLAYIKEQLNRYNVYGIEIDYMREPYICSPGEEENCRKIMLEFFGEIKKIIATAEEKYNHKIKLSVRAFRDPLTTYDAGLDIYTLIRKKIIDLVIPTPRFKTCDSDMPIYEWRKVFEGTGVEIAAGCDHQYQVSLDKTYLMNKETGAALAMQYLTGGADYIYLYNYTYSEDFEIYKFLGDVSLLEKRERRHIVSFQDVGYIHSTLYRPLPVQLCDGYLSGGYKYIRIQTGKISEGAKVILRLGCNKKLEKVYVNSAPCVFAGTVKIEPEYFDGDIQEFEITKYNQTQQMVEIKSEEDGAVLSYAEIRVIPQ